MYIRDPAITKTKTEIETETTERRIEKKKNTREIEWDEESTRAAKFLCTCLTIPTYVN